VQGGHQVGFRAGQLTAQNLGEQVVIAEPLPVLIQRDDEQVLALERVDERGRVARIGDGTGDGTGDGIAQRRTEPAEDRGPGEELADLGRLLAEYVFDQESTMNRLSPVKWRTKAADDG
jgi:hypothetical protein